MPIFTLKTRIPRKSTICGALVVSILLPLAGSGRTQAQAPSLYQPTLQSLDAHPLPDWFADDKLGVMIVWGLYSVPGWAPLVHKDHDFTSADYLKDDPYAEWYSNAMRIPGSPTQAYHREHYGADFEYYDFDAAFNRESRKWNPQTMAEQLRDAGVRYVVVTTKFHDGYRLWPTAVPNPNQKRLDASRDIMGELTTAVRQAGMRMGIYYSGGLDWTFDRGPIRVGTDYDAVKPESQAYGDYAFAQVEELIAKYHPALLWNDIDWPRTGKPLQVMADYYNAVPDGVIDDRFGVPHSDFTSPEYKYYDEIRAKKWEECRGLGQSFGYNRAEGEADTIAPADLIALLADVVSKNGNLMLGVGPEADGSISPVQLDRLRSLGAWLRQNGESIYGTRPWTRATAKTADGQDVRFTQKGGNLYAIVLGSPRPGALVIPAVTAAAGAQITVLGVSQPIAWKQSGPDLAAQLPASLPGKYAYVLRIPLPR